ncbi:MAG: NYN domain-containing protein [Fermentimonas sp.]|nr:NYN domain-containing protein [Fermentimonas sp.]
MKNLDELKKIAILIDAENAQLTKLKGILAEISTHGHIIVKRAYGDWANPCLKNWKDDLNELAIQPIQQFSYTSGKNATDAAMIIDAMDLLYQDKYDAFALVSSDSDFTKLAARLRESEIFVFGVGEKKTPKSFRNACDDFILTENIDKDSTPDESIEMELDALISEGNSKGEDKEVNLEDPMKSVENLLDLACEKYAENDGWVNAASAGSFVKRSMSDFDPRTFGFKKFTDLISSLPEKYETTKDQSKGSVGVVYYRKRSKN